MAPYLKWAHILMTMFSFVTQQQNDWVFILFLSLLYLPEMWRAHDVSVCRYVPNIAFCIPLMECKRHGWVLHKYSFLQARLWSWQWWLGPFEESSQVRHISFLNFLYRISFSENIVNYRCHRGWTEVLFSLGFVCLWAEYLKKLWTDADGT